MTYPSPCDTRGWIEWYRGKNPLSPHPDAIAFTMFQVERQIGCNVGLRASLLDGLYKDSFQSEHLSHLIQATIKQIRELDSQDEVARNFLAENYTHQDNPLYAVPRGRYMEEKRGRLKWLRENRENTIKVQKGMVECGEQAVK